jgi:hypothetical protein
MNLPVPTESEEGKVLVAYLRTRGLRFTHVANETGHTPEALRRAIRMKQQGTSKGFPDYIILLPKQHALLAIELKRQRGSNTSIEQADWIMAFCQIDGCEGIIAKGAKDAIEFIEKISYVHPKKTVDSQPF